MDWLYLIKNFFTHKDFLLPADQLWGTMFTPLHFAFAAVVLAVIILSVRWLYKRPVETVRRVWAVLWALMVVLEVVKILWESTAGKTVGIEWGGILPLYPCSIFMYAMPFAIWGRGWARKAACGYVCTLGLLGGTVNFVYPATILGSYSCISFAGFHTFFYHGAMLLTALTMLLSGYHSYRDMKKWWELVLPAVPALIVSIPANLVNFSPIGSDYMFFKGNSFFLPAIFGGLSDGVTVALIYLAYILVPALFYLPGYLRTRRNASTAHRKT